MKRVFEGGFLGSSDCENSRRGLGVDAEYWTVRRRPSRTVLLSDSKAFVASAWSLYSM